MKRSLALLPLVLAVSGCSNLPILQGLGMGGAFSGQQPRVVCSLKGNAELLQGIGGLATTTPLPDVDVVCAALVKQKT